MSDAHTLVPVTSPEDVLAAYRGTEIEDFLLAHNLNRPIATSGSATSLIMTCMDPRIDLHLPVNFAFVVRTAGAATEPVLSNIAFAVAMAGVTSISVMGHTDCAMTRVNDAKDAFAQTLTSRESVSAQDAGTLVKDLDETFKVDDPVASTWAAAEALADMFPSCLVAPLLYQVEDHAIVQISR